MKWILWLLALLGATAAVTFLLQYGEGHVRVTAPPYRIELSLSLAMVLLLGLVLILYFVVWLTLAALRLPSEIGELRRRRRREKANDALLESLRTFFEGRYDKAEQAATAALALQEPAITRAISTVVAARCAHALGKFSRRDEFLTAMETAVPEEVFLRLVTQAELLLDQDRPGAALEAARALRLRGNPADPALLRLELKTQQRLENWDAVLDLLSLLKRHDALDETSIRKQWCHAHAQNLKNRPSIQAFREYWQALTPADRADGTVTTAAVRTCVALSDCATARRIIEQSLDRNWNSELAGLYGTCPDTDVLGQIERAEAWLSSHPGDARLLLALGRLCTHCELWGKARSYLEASLSVEPGHSAHLALASLDERSGHPELAQHHYRQALEWALGRRAPDAGRLSPDEAGKTRSG